MNKLLRALDRLLKRLLGEKRNPSQDKADEFMAKMQRELDALPEISDWEKMPPGQRIAARGHYFNVCSENGNFHERKW